MRKTGFYPSTDADSKVYQEASNSMDRARLVKAAPHSMFIMKSHDFVHAQEALEDAAGLAKSSHARLEMTAEEFECRFSQFVRKRVSWGPGRAAVLQHDRRQKARERWEKL